MLLKQGKMKASTCEWIVKDPMLMRKRKEWWCSLKFPHHEILSNITPYFCSKRGKTHAHVLNVTRDLSTFANYGLPFPLTSSLTFPFSLSSPHESQMAHKRTIDVFPDFLCLSLSVRKDELYSLSLVHVSLTQICTPLIHVLNLKTLGNEEEEEGSVSK